MKPKVGSLKKKIDRALAIWAKKKIEDANYWNQKWNGDIITDSAEIKMIKKSAVNGCKPTNWIT